MVGHWGPQSLAVLGILLQLSHEEAQESPGWYGSVDYVLA